jgi:hypothetical protein
MGDPLFMQQFKNGFLPKSFDGEWSTLLERIQVPEHEHEFRELRNLNLDDFVIPFARLALTERFPLTSFPRAWNNFNNIEVKTIRSKPDFNSKLKDHFLSMLNSNFTCSRLLCPHCHLNNN